MTNENNDQQGQQNDQKQVLKQFGRLAIHRQFMYFAAMDGLPEDWHKHQRGPRRVFAVLAERDGMTNAELAEELDVRPSSVTALVDRLEQQGMVSREPSPTDGRVTLIRLTAEGKDRVAQRSDEQEKMMSAALKTLTREDQEKLVELLRRVADNLDALYPDELKGGLHGRGRGFGGRGFPQHPDFQDRGFGPGFRGPDQRFRGFFGDGE
jgi:DNA-binding MarR family transcriptional regulator